MNTVTIKKIISIDAEPFLRQHRVLHASLAGSFARGEQNKKSDIDLVIETEKGFSLFDLGAIKIYLEAKTGRSVDLVKKKAIRPEIKKQILSSTISLF